MVEHQAAAVTEDAPEGRASAVMKIAPRLLVVAAIWGIAVFLWGTFGAWTYTQQLNSERQMARAKAPALNEWLMQAVEPLRRLADDKRLGAAMSLPAGVESLPVQRVLYEYSYLTHQSEIYIVDMLRKRVGRTAGAEPLSPETIERIANLPEGGVFIMGMGQRNGQMLLMRSVDAPLPNRLVVMVPVSLLTLAATEPSTWLPGERKMALVVPHTTGYALWKDGGQGFELSDSLNAAMGLGGGSLRDDEGLTVMTPLEGWPGVSLAVQTTHTLMSTQVLPQLLVGLWAVLMTMLALWDSSSGLRQGLQDRLTGKVPSKLNKLGPLVKTLGGLGGKLTGMVARIVGGLASRWGEANAEAPLVAGPGGFGREDFVSLDEIGQRMQPRKPRVLPKPAALGALAPGNRRKAERRKTPRPGDDRRMRALDPNSALAAWQKAAQVVPPIKPKEETQEFFDKNDINAVVEDALKRKRLRLLYQPIYRVHDNMPVMHEVYARLLKGGGQVMTPDIFMPVVTNNRLTLQLDLLVLRKVVQEHFTGRSPLTPLALNISSNSLDGLAYLQELVNLGPRVLQKISFEVNSQEMIRDPKALRLLKDIQKHGGNISVDYFGGGTAMLDASKAMGFNSVKLNAMKMSGTDAGKKDIILLCQYARSIGMPVVMEMVGDNATETFARRAGAEFLQGYALARPSEHLTIEPITPNLSEMEQVAKSAAT